MKHHTEKTVAIIGCGPRGLNAVENIFIEFSKLELDIKLKVLVFERTGLFGCGQVYAPQQTEHNWMNLSERHLTIDGRPEIILRNINIPSFPSYHDWKACDFSDGNQKDTYPARAEVGKYLKSRFMSMARHLEDSGWLECVSHLIEDATFENNSFTLEDERGKVYNADEVVLTIGHQPTELSGQLVKWQDAIAQHNQLTLVGRAYPLRELDKELQFTNTINIAIRGFGLAMIDIARAIAGLTGSTFEIIDPKTQAMRFVPSESFPKCLIPFSLDGLPMHPKPINQNINQWFAPKEAVLHQLHLNLLKTLGSPNSVTDVSFLKLEMAQIIANIFKRLEERAVPHQYSKAEIETIILDYLDGNTTNMELIMSADLPLHVQLERYCAMANGTGTISLDYCIGQVWRHCHPTLYKSLSFTELDASVIHELITLDERLKRLTFGPPLSSVQQLLAMIKADKLVVKVLDDPDISVNKNGWYLEDGNDDFYAEVMINSVLDSPTVTEVETPLIQNLLAKGYIRPIHAQLGVATHSNGLVKTTSNRFEMPLALLGRLAQGTLLGVDAILECFGKRSEDWAKGLMERL